MPIIFENQGEIKELAHLNDLKKMIHHSHYQKNGIISLSESRFLIPTESRSRPQQKIKGAKPKVIFIFPHYIDINGNQQPNPDYVGDRCR